MTHHFNRASRTGLNRASRTIGGPGWAKKNGQWHHAATGLRR